MNADTLLEPRADSEAAPNAGRLRRIRYPVDFRRQVVRLIVADGRECAAMAAEIGVSRKTMRRWMRELG
jgi:transposase-like protein